MNSVFSEQILADKLSKLNSTQQCIETLSHWCIFHQDKAELVVTTWDKQFHNSQMTQKVPLLYLANDILQNSKRKGNEFVTEFWKVLPAALKDLSENGDERGKTVVSRLVSIWEERKVFGSRIQSLKDVMLGGEALPPLEFNKKRPRPVRITKRDSRSIRTKLSIGGTAEKIVSAFHLVQSEHHNEDAEMSKCMSAAHRVKKLEKDVELACANEKDPKRQTLAKELEEEEHVLKQCIEKLKSVEASRLALVSQLKEALHEQESELENIRTQMQVAEAQAEEARNMQKQLNGEEYVSKSQQASKRTAASIAAEVADKLTASSSSQMIMTSVLSTFAAEEAKKAGLTKTPSASNPSTPIPSNSISESISKADYSMMASDSNNFVQAQPLPVSSTHSFQPGVMPQQSLQNQGQNSQAQYHLLPNATSQQFIQPTAGIMASYGYGQVAPLPPGPPPPPPPPPPPSHMINSIVPLMQQTLQMTQQPLVPLAQQPPAPPSFRPVQPPGMVYYSHLHHTQ